MPEKSELDFAGENGEGRERLIGLVFKNGPSF
jgi:hypothetical protein